MVRIKRIYDPPEADDGKRILVDRLWPRGISKEEAHVDEWARELAPSTDLRKWFGHDPERWEEFRSRYSAELQESVDLLENLRIQAQKGTVTLLFAARDAERNNAVVLKELLEKITPADG